MTDDVVFLIHAEDLAQNAVVRFEDWDDNCDDNVGGNVSIDDGVDTRACYAASGITTSVITGNSAATC